MKIRNQWLVVLGLALGVTVSNAFARFAYGLILPAMQADLDWTYTQAGWINTANALGYILGALGTFAVVRRISANRLFVGGLLLTAFGLIMSGLHDSFRYLTFWRIAAGIGGAPAFIAGGALAAALFPNDPGKNALAIAGYFGGGGLGMVLSGAVLPGLFETHGDAVWPYAWIALGGVSFLFLPLSIWAAKRVRIDSRDTSTHNKLPLRQMIFLLAGYGMFAMGYIVYLTFIVARMAELNLPPSAISVAWITIGLGIILSPFVWKPILVRFASGTPLALTCLSISLATVWPVLFPTFGGVLLSALCFGLAVFIGPSAMTSFGRHNLTPVDLPRAVSLFTIVFAVGQTFGPVVAGFISDETGQLSSGFLSAGAVLAAGAAFALLQRPLSRQSNG